MRARSNPLILDYQAQYAKLNSKIYDRADLVKAVIKAVVKRVRSAYFASIDPNKDITDPSDDFTSNTQRREISYVEKSEIASYTGMKRQMEKESDDSDQGMSYNQESFLTTRE